MDKPNAAPDAKQPAFLLPFRFFRAEGFRQVCQREMRRFSPKTSAIGIFLALQGLEYEARVQIKIKAGKDAVAAEHQGPARRVDSPRIGEPRDDPSPAARIGAAAERSRERNRDQWTWPGFLRRMPGTFTLKSRACARYRKNANLHSPGK
jgi:hypothetical protein